MPRLSATPFVTGAMLLVTLVPGVTQDEAVESTETDTSARAGSEGTVVPYGPDFFSIYNPVTALDMVERVPGFTIEAGGAVRGFGGAAGNVLIDGERPSAKGQSIRDILGQIPAENVVRVDLIRGRAAGIDMRDQTVVVNVLRRESRTGRFAEVSFALNEGMRLTPTGELSLTGDAAGFGYTVGLRHFALEDLDDQPERLLDAAGNVVEFREEEASIRPRDSILTVNLEKDVGRWQTRLNNELVYSDFVFVESSPAFSVPGNDLVRRDLTSVEDGTVRGEIGADAERSLSPSASLKLIGLQTVRQLDSRQRFRQVEASGPSRTVRQTIDELAGESILRGIVTFVSDASRRTFELGLEGAFNVLDSTVALSVDEGSGAVAQDLPISDTRVEELRGEIFGNTSLKPADDWVLEFGLTTEISFLSQSGDAQEERSFLFVKPSVNVVRELTDRHQLRLEIFREVGQLDFGDFVSSVTLNEQTTDLGNPQLEPQHAWVARAQWEGRFSERDTLSLLVERRWLEAVQELIPVGGMFDAPGNIGDGTLWRKRIEWQVDLHRIGLPNAVLEGWWEHVESEVTDPVTGEERDLQFLVPATGQPLQEDRVRMEFRQDFPVAGWAWGADYFFGSSFDEFRIDERRRIEFGPSDLDLFVETTRLLGMKLRLVLERFEPRVERRRVLFDGPRSAGVVRAVEAFDRSPETRAVLSLRRSF